MVVHTPLKKDTTKVKMRPFPVIRIIFDGYWRNGRRTTRRTLCDSMAWQEWISKEHIESLLK